MKKTKQVLNILNFNWKSLIGFEIIFKLLSLMIFTPLFVMDFNVIMKLTGFKYLTLENIGSFLLNPLTLVMLIILFLFMTLYTMFDITTVITILDASYHKKKIKVIDAIRMSLAKCKKVFRLKNISLAFFVLFLIPFLNIGLSSNFIGTIKIPEFIMDFIRKNQTLLILFIILMILLAILLLRWIYSLHYFVIEDLDFQEARKKSINLSSKKHIKDLVTLTLIQLGITIIYFLFIIVGIFIILVFNKLLGKIIFLKSIISTVIWIFIALSIIIVTVLSTPISYASISVLFYLHKKEKEEEIKGISIKESKSSKKINKRFKYVFGGISLIAFILATLFTYGLYKGKYNLNIEYVRTLEVTAHRGASVNSPENTMASFIRAKELGADWIELDVQQTKDGKIIVIHDTNLKRTTGVNKNTWEVTYDDIKELDAGSHLDKKFKNERIPLLEEVVKWAKENNMRLNIELKPTGYEKDFEKNVVDIVKKYNYENSSVITSQVLEVLENVKNYDEKIETVYVMSLAYGEITSLTKVDNFSIEATSITETLVKKVHKEGKELYAWTVNTPENIQKMIDLKVDNIITDDITLAKDTIYSSKTSNLINEYVKLVQNLF